MGSTMRNEEAAAEHALLEGNAKTLDKLDSDNRFDKQIGTDFINKELLNIDVNIIKAYSPKRMQRKINMLEKKIARKSKVEGALPLAEIGKYLQVTKLTERTEETVLTPATEKNDKANTKINLKPILKLEATGRLSRTQGDGGFNHQPPFSLSGKEKPGPVSMNLTQRSKITPRPYELDQSLIPIILSQQIQESTEPSVVQPNDKYEYSKKFEKYYFFRENAQNQTNKIENTYNKVFGKRSQSLGANRICNTKKLMNAIVASPKLVDDFGQKEKNLYEAQKKFESTLKYG